MHYIFEPRAFTDTVTSINGDPVAPGTKVIDLPLLIDITEEQYMGLPVWYTTEVYNVKCTDANNVSYFVGVRPPRKPPIRTCPPEPTNA